MPNRIIRESCRASKSLNVLSSDLRAEAFFWRLVTVADDYGRFLAEPNVMLSICFPCRPKPVTETHVGRWMQMLAHANIVKFYENNGTTYGVFLNWERHQGHPRAKASKYPDPDESVSIGPQMSANVLVSESESEKRESNPKAYSYIGSARRQTWLNWVLPEDLRGWAIREGAKPDDLPWIVEEFRDYWLDQKDSKLPKNPGNTFRNRILLLKSKGILGKPQGGRVE